MVESRDARGGARASGARRDREMVARRVAAPGGDALHALPAAPHPAWVPPMLATLTDARFSDPGWVFERKLDGERVLGFRQGSEVRLLSRSRQHLNGTYPELVDALRAQRTEDFVVDGEVVAFEGRRTSFGRLPGRLGITDPVRARASGIPVFYYLFDVLHLEGHDPTGLALRDRKALLRRAVTFGGPLRATAQRNGTGERFLAEACRHGWEGLIAKRADAPYVAGRSRAWLKMKCSASQEFVVIGYTDPAGSRVGLGALLVGYYDKDRLRYAGKVGTGYTREVLMDLRRRLDRLAVDVSPLSPPSRVAERGVHWVRPELVAQVVFSEWTADGKLRHPRFEGLRTDKPAGEVVRERGRDAAHHPRGGRPGDPAEQSGQGPLRRRRAHQGRPRRVLPRRRAGDAPPPARSAPHAAALPGRHRRRLLLPEAGAGPRPGLGAHGRGAQGGWCRPPRRLRRRGDPRLPRRPGLHRPPHVALARGPLRPAGPGRLRLRPVPARLRGGAGGGVGGARAPVGPRARPVRRDHRLARPARRGPLVRRSSFDEVRAFARLAGAVLAAADPAHLTTEMRKERRRGRVLVDVLRNGYAQTAVAPYSVRTLPGAPVAAPLEWAELDDPRLGPRHVRVATARRRLDARGDPWADLARHAKPLGGARRLLEARSPARAG